MRKLTILDSVDDIYKALDSKAYLSALALALTIPDILSKVEYPEIRYVGERYVKWMDEFFLTDEEEKARMEGNEPTDELGTVLDKLDGQFFYELRCAFLHAGNNDVESLKGVEFDLTFDACECTAVWGYPGTPYQKRHVLKVPDFCMKVCSITEHLFEEWKTAAEKWKRLENTGVNLFCLDTEDYYNRV